MFIFYVEFYCGRWPSGGYAWPQFARLPHKLAELIADIRLF